MNTSSYSNRQLPKTFQEIAERNKHINQSATSFNSLVSKLPLKNIIKEPIIRKSNSQFINYPLANNLNRKLSNIKKENMDFKSIVIDRKNNQSSITTPSFLKNILKNTKSFIHPQHYNQFNQSSFHLGSQQSQRNSINLSDKNSDDVCLFDTSLVEDMNVDSSFELTKDVKHVTSKIKIISDNSLNFGNKINHEQKSIQLIINHLNNSTKQTQKSFNDNPTLSSINFSKKLIKQSSIVKSIEKLEINDFDLIEQIGCGKYGKVYMSMHKETGFLCAIKCVSKHIIKQQQLQLPFIHEIKIQSYLNHPNIIKLYGFFSDQQYVYLIMQYCSGGHLLKLMKQKSVFSQNQILQVLSNIFEAVSYIHCLGIIHRDLKPQNIVIENGIYKLCDFGWAAYTRGDMRTTFCGTPLYVSPQILKGEEYDEKIDVWGLGVITFELAYGRVPFPIWTQSDMRKIVNDPVYFPAWANLSQKMQNLIKTMLFKNPQHRCSINEILNHGIIKEYLGYQRSIKSQIDSLF